MLDKIHTICFDADDTLWVNEPLFRQTEAEFFRLIAPYANRSHAHDALFATVIGNLPWYGYGVKGLVLAMLETALHLSQYKIKQTEIEQIMALGKQQLAHDVVLIDGVEEVLRALQGRYRLVLATKGDMLDQERKLEHSGLAAYFDHVEIMSEKNEISYKKLFRTLTILPKNLLMVGNSLKSDILPVVQLGAQAAYVPFEITWQHENVDEIPENMHYFTLNSIKELLDWV